MTFNKWSLYLFVIFIIVSFQNCGGSKSSFPPSGPDASSSKKANTTASSPSGTSGSGGVTGVTIGSSSGATRSPTSGSSSGVAASYPGSGAAGTPSGGSTGASGSAAAPSGSGVALAFTISEQPSSQTLAEGSEFTIKVVVKGGRSPYKYKWFLNNQPLTSPYGVDQYDLYTSTLDRIYKEGDYYAVITDATGKSLTSTKALIRMNSVACTAGAYWFPVTTKTNYPDVMNWFGDLFIYGQSRFFVSQQNPIISQMQGKYSSSLTYLGFSYFNLNAPVASGKDFSISCNTEVPTIQSPVCNRDFPNKCIVFDVGSADRTRYYQGSVDFKCRNGYLEFLRNTCSLVTPPPPAIYDGGN